MAIAKRSFSKLKLVMIRLRKATDYDRLDRLVMMFGEIDVTDELKLEELLKVWLSSKTKTFEFLIVGI